MNETAENNPSHVVPGFRDFLPPNRNISGNSSSSRDFLDKNQNKMNAWDVYSPEQEGRTDIIRKISWDSSGDIVTPAGQLSAERKAVAYDETPQNKNLLRKNSGQDSVD
mmetsp:Transcript_3511/g.5443  ORF Transcript_3511/g.5443 Transcript_3511/m.5443 type:complete len:109 (+) Transcript_3511:849-1175(+)